MKRVTRKVSTLHLAWNAAWNVSHPRCTRLRTSAQPVVFSGATMAKKSSSTGISRLRTSTRRIPTAEVHAALIGDLQGRISGAHARADDADDRLAILEARVNELDPLTRGGAVGGKGGTGEGAAVCPLPRQTGVGALAPLVDRHPLTPTGRAAVEAFELWRLEVDDRPAGEGRATLRERTLYLCMRAHLAAIGYRDGTVDLGAEQSGFPFPEAPASSKVKCVSPACTECTPREGDCLKCAESAKGDSFPARVMELAAHERASREEEVRHG